MRPYDMQRLGEMSCGGGDTDTSHLNTDEEKFLHVVEYGLNWEAPKGRRSGYDFAQSLDFVELLKATPDLPQRYLEFTMWWAVGSASAEESRMEAVGVLGADDGLADVRWIWHRIEAAMDTLGQPWVLDAKLMALTLRELEVLRPYVLSYWEEMEECFEDDESEELARCKAQGVKTHVVFNGLVEDLKRYASKAGLTSAG